MILIDVKENSLFLATDAGDLLPKHENQLAFWGLRQHEHNAQYSVEHFDVSLLLEKVTTFLTQSRLQYSLSESAEALASFRGSERSILLMALQRGRSLKDGAIDAPEMAEFMDFLRCNICRRLKEHQIKACLHFISTRNAANFSVPGSGKTTVVLAVFQRLRLLDEIDALFVVGPPACFGPWRSEYVEVLGTTPLYEVLAGGNVEIRKTKYHANKDNVCDLYLTSFQTLQRDSESVLALFKQRGIRFLFVVDEAHYVKQIDGIWARTLLKVSRHAARRCILTGTPFPHSYRDAFNLFDILWPDNQPIPPDSKHRIEMYEHRKELDRAAGVLNDAIGPLFYRVRKSDLRLAPQHLHPPIVVRMKKYERLVYDSILARIHALSAKDYSRDIDLLSRIRKGRMMRLRQCISYTALLDSALEEHSEDLTDDDLSLSLSEIIRSYDDLEVPGKLEALVKLVDRFVGRGEKIIIWSNFVRTLELLHDTVSNLGYGTKLIYGATPIEGTNTSDDLTREEIIREFVRQDSLTRVLIANPAACAESISLHKTCSHAVYYDLSYNCAQYIQSLDRIHRVGGSENKPANYYFLQYEDTFESDILANLRTKAEKMAMIIDHDYAIYSLDMFEDDGDLDAYNRLFGGGPM